MILGFAPVLIDVFGGLVTRIDRSDLDIGLSPNCVNVEFFPGGYKSRVGFVAQATDAAGYVNGIGSFRTTAGVRQRLYLFSNGTLKYETPEGTLTSLQTGLQNDMLMKSTVLFNRIYMAFSDGKVPQAHARQWDGTNFDPVTQDGVPQYPDCVSSALAGTKGTAGFHKFLMVVETRNGALCQPSTENGSVTQAGGQGYRFNNITLGPPNTLRRRIYMTPVVVNGDATKLYTIPQLWLNNNTTTGTWDADFSDTELLAGEPLEGDVTKDLPNLLNVVPLPPVLSIGSYANRLIGMGPLASIPRQVIPELDEITPMYEAAGDATGYANLLFTGGPQLFDATAPNGWYRGAGTGGTLGALATVAGNTVQCWEISCDGNTYNSGGLGVGGPPSYAGELWSTYQGTRVKDYTGANIYNYRVRMKKTGSFTGNFIIGLVGGASSTVPAASITTDWAWYTGQLFNASQQGSMFFGVSGATTNGTKLQVDAIEIYLSTVPVEYARAYVSTRYSPEAYDIVTGIVDVNPGDGQGLRDGFELGGAYYWVKERSLWRSQDNGLEPLYWDGPDLISDVVGSPSIHGVGIGDRWVVICGEQGVYRFDGGFPENLSDEIRPTWKRVNWNYGHLIWCVVDPENQRIHIGVPLDASTTVNTMLVLDYSDGWVSGISSPGSGRKWSQWTGTAVAGFRCGARVERDSGRRIVIFGGGVSGSQGFVARQDPTEAAIVDNFGYGNSTLTCTYETAPIGGEVGRSQFGFLVYKAGGSGALRSYLVRPGGTTRTLASADLLDASNNDIEVKTRGAVDTQTSVRIVVGATGAVGVGQGNIRLKRLALFRKDAKFSRFRGKNEPEGE